jgi:hypothetical protein
MGLEPFDPQSPQSHKWQLIPVTEDMTPDLQVKAIRLNSFGSLFYFAKIVLGYTRLSTNLHAYMCKELERESLRISMEIPRAHFKTTVGAISLPMWWSLPFTDNDEMLMRALGYGDAWIRWMRLAHYSSTRTLIAMETLLNARKKGAEISSHYESNALFRRVFPEIIPKRSDHWNQDSMTHNRVDNEFHGEGTYDLIGVKGALQSRHYPHQVIDDPVGEKAVGSDLVMEATIEWMRKLPGAFDSNSLYPDKLADQVFIGNRWSLRDVGSWLRKEVPEVQILTHSAEGGCCKLHPAGQPIFPEEFSMEKLAQIRQIEGSYHYASQYLNNPVDPTSVRFQTSWLRYYSQVPWEAPRIQKDEQTPADVLNKFIEEQEEAAGATPLRLIMALHHETQSGEAIDDVRALHLDRVAILDPNHSEEKGRSRHAIVILGFLNHPPEPRRIYLLDCWAGAVSFEEMIEKLIGTTPEHLGLAIRWRVGAIYLESEVAGQQGWKYYFKDRVNAMGTEASFSIRALKTDRSAGGKDRRITGMEPIYENGLFWVRRTGQEAFMEEYESYPNGRTNDILDVIGYAPQCWAAGVSPMDVHAFMEQEMARRRRMAASIGSGGY